ncbi:MAG: ATP-binding protein [Actinomycetota bacterium]
MTGRSRFSLTLSGPLSMRPGAARRWAADRCAELRLECAAVGLPLLVSELVTNACIHGADPITLRLQTCRARARVEVVDSTPEWPELQWPDDNDPYGRGVLIVESLSHAWGTDSLPTGKVVWAEVLVGESDSEALERVDRR